MSTSSVHANSLLNLIYRAIAIANLADNAASGPATALDIALHTASPVTTLQSSNEATYVGYARVPIARSGAGWNAASGGIITNVALIQFVECVSGSNTITHVSIGLSGTILSFGPLVASRAVSGGIQPQFAPTVLGIQQT